MMNKLSFVLVIIVIGIFSYWFGSQKTQFNSQLVEQKQKCQDAFLNCRGKLEKGRCADGFRAHFNQHLNACLVETYYGSPTDGDTISSVIDIYENKILLELDYDAIASPIGYNLYENHQKVDVSSDNAQKEFGKRLAILFEETASDHH